MQLNLYLTFDDGPSKTYTPELLDLLKEFNIQASFFVVAEFAEQNPHIIFRMRDEGHCIGLHSLDHRSAYVLSPRHAKMDFEQSINILKGMGIDINGYRPPWGHQTPWSKVLARHFGLKTVLWDVMAEDWRKNSTPNMFAEKLSNRVFDEAVICLHDGRGRDNAPKRMIEALKLVLPKWIENGYKFKKIDE